MTYAVGVERLSDPKKSPVEVSPSASPGPVVMIWLYGMLIFLPVKVFQFPSNLELVDLWVIFALPIFWLSFIISRRPLLGKAYSLPLFLILIASFASALAAPDPYGATIYISKEIYLFVWFVTLSTVLSTLDPRSLRAFVTLWAIVATLHGLIIIAQFLSPTIWRMTTDFAGQSTAYADYRPSGLFVTAKAGDANKAAVFQLLGFVPLMLSKPPRMRGFLMATIVLCSILATGSMGNTSAFAVGLVVSIVAVTLFDKSSTFVKKYLVQLVFAGLVLLGVFAVVIEGNPAYREHFETIITGRAEKSSSGRFGLWGRGFDAFVKHDVLLWGVGPENFRVVDPSGNDNQLHNDFLAFTVERGLIAVLGLLLFGLVAVSRAFFLLRMHGKYPGSPGIVVVVFLAGMASILFVSITHQIFHTRSLWILLALQESMVYRVRNLTGIEHAGPALDRASHPVPSYIT